MSELQYRHGKRARHSVESEFNQMVPLTNAQFAMQQVIAPVGLCHLPDEILLHIIANFELRRPRDARALQALDLTCHKMKTMVTDKRTINSMLCKAKLVQIVANQTWNPRLLFRLSKYASQIDNLVQVVWPAWLEIRKLRPHHALPVDNIELFMRGLNSIVRIDGLEDNRPSCMQLKITPFADKVCMLIAALVFQEVFLDRYIVVMPLHTLRHALRSARTALRYILMVQGPFVALQVFTPTSQELRHSRINYADHPAIRALIANGRQVLQLPHVHPSPGDRLIPSTLCNIMLNDLHPPYSVLNTRPPHNPVSLRIEIDVEHIVNHWVLTHRPKDLFVGDPQAQELVKCIAEWEHGCCLL